MTDSKNWVLTTIRKLVLIFCIFLFGYFTHVAKVTIDEIMWDVCERYSWGFYAYFPEPSCYRAGLVRTVRELEKIYRKDKKPINPPFILQSS